MSSPKAGQSLDKRPTDSTELLTVAEAANLLGVSAATIRRLQQQRRIPFFNIGRCVRVSGRDLAAYLAKRRVESIG